MKKSAIGFLFIALMWAVGPTAFAGRIFVTGHDPIWHSNFGANSTGAINLATAGIDFALGGSSKPFLFVESTDVAVPSGNARTASFLNTQLGYGLGDYTVMNGTQLSAIADFGSFLTGYSAIVVASDHGGMLTASELSFLNNNKTTIIDFLNAGGGLFAEAQSNAKGLIGSETPYGFLPFLVSSTSFGAFESGNTVTPYGASEFGLVDSDVNGNFSHNYFSSTGGMNAVDLFNGDPNKILTLAYEGRIGEGGVVPEPMTLSLIGLGLIGLVASRKRRG